jgi:long-subunit fatty acid transport protein
VFGHDAEDVFAAPPQLGGFGYTEVTAAAKMTNLSAMAFSGKIGIAWNANENVTFGVGYSSSATLNYKKGKAKMDMTYQFNDAFGKAVQGAMMQNPTWTPQQAQAAVMQQFGQMGIDPNVGFAGEYDLEAKLKTPQSIGFGAMVKLSDNVRLATDFEWVNWKNAYEKMTLNLSGGTNANINRMMGNRGTFSVDFPMNWEDAYCAKIGFEADVTDPLTLRLGGAFGGNPVSNETIFPVFPAITENHVTVGASYKLSPALIVHVAYERAFNNAQKSLSPSLVAQEYSGSTSELNEDIFHFSFSWLMP